MPVALIADSMIDIHQLTDAYQIARRDLLARREPEGHWVGQLSASSLSTATAASALSLVAKESEEGNLRNVCLELSGRAIEWLVRSQNEDGGWGDTDKSFSNIATTMLAQAAFHLTGSAEHHAELLDRAQRYIDSEGGIDGLRRRYGKDKTFAVPILTNCALAGLVPWKSVPPLPFELACFPHKMLRLARLPVVSYAIPALVAIGQARFFHQKPLNPATRTIRRLAVGRSLKVLEKMQPASGGYIEAIPLTSFVVMSLAGTGRVDHSVVQNGVKFLVNSVLEDGSWPIDTNLATWNTTGAITALAGATGDVGALGGLDWLLECQHREPHPFTQAAPGGWGWSDLSGAVPDADDTSGALLALVRFYNSMPARQEQIQAAAVEGVRWLLNIQNADGGWPTFCRGWGALPFDRSGADLTAHAIRAIAAWRPIMKDNRSEKAVNNGFDYLAKHQRPDGSWAPLWFGNQHNPEEENPVYGTARVLLAYRDMGRLDSGPARRGLQWLVDTNNPDGGWGNGNEPEVSSTEETAVAVEALLAAYDAPSIQPVVEKGLEWLMAAVASGRHQETSPIGLYFAKLWYYECMYPLSFTVAALGQAVRRISEEKHPSTAPTDEAEIL